MDNGLILLNTIETSEHVKFDWYFAGKSASWIAVIGAAILVIIGILLLIKAQDASYYDRDGIIAFGIICILLSVGIIIITLIHEVTKPYPQYQVTITEKTNMKEFYNKYDILKQDGMIFTIRDKDYKERDYE